jgi:serine/threonine-protein kinase
MDAVVRKALAKKPAERFQSAQEFIAALQAASVDDPDATVRAAPTAAVPAAVGIRASAPVRGVPAPSAAAAGKPQTAAIAIVVGVLVLAGVAGAWMMSGGSGGGAPPATGATTAAGAPASAGPTTPALATPSASTAQPPAPATPGAAPAAAPPGTVADLSAPASAPDPGTMVIAAVGLADPFDPRYQKDPALLQADLRADSKSQLVAKALGLMVARESLNKNYAVVQSRLLANSSDFIGNVLQESAPQTGKDGLVSLTTQAAVNVRALQKSLNQMSRDERIDLIRAGGDPKVAVRINVSDVGQTGVPPLPSPVAENLLKERIKSFGFRTWSEGENGGSQSADFLVQGEAKIKRLSMRLEASGVVITKYALTSWTVKCIDRATGEEIYFDTTLPQGLGTWASEEQALKAIGTRIADAFSRNFFLQHVVVSGRKVSLQLSGLPDAAAEDLFGRELLGLPAVIGQQQGPPAKPRVYALQLAGAGGGGDLVLGGVLAPLNAKLGQACFSLGAVTGDQVAVTFAAECATPPILSRLETNPPAGLYGAPEVRQKAVVKNPDTLRKLVI